MKTRNGFTLVEVLIALAILMIGIIGAFQLFPIALTQIRVARERNVITELADSKFNQLRGLGGRNLVHHGDAVMASGFNFNVRAMENGSAIYDAYSTNLSRLNRERDVYLQRVIFTADMPDGRRERFVTYITEP